MIVALETPTWVWYLMRGSGLVALILLTLTIALGVTGIARWQSSRWPRVVTAGLHRNLSLLAVCFLALHVVTAALDSWIGLGWLGVLVPFRSSYRPIWVGLGVVAGDLLLAILATSLLRRHIGYRSWRVVHWAGWLMWPVALVHAFGSGTDAWSPWGLAIGVACVAIVAAAAVWRLCTRRPASTGTGPALGPAGRPSPSPALDPSIDDSGHRRRSARPLTSTGGHA